VWRLAFWPSLIILLAVPAYSQTSAPVVSAEHVSEGLKRPTLEIPPLPTAEAIPTFKVRVESGRPVETPLDGIRRELGTESGRAGAFVPGTAGGAPPLVTVDILAVYGAIRKGVQQARREHAEQEARRQVAEDLAAFCAINDCSQRDPIAAESVIIPQPPSAPRR
jgi:hypothetical protein